MKFVLGKDKKAHLAILNIFQEVNNMPRHIKYTYYICRCGKKIIPFTNPCKCPHCGRVTVLRK